MVAKLVSIGDLLASGASKSSVKRALWAFQCARNDDVVSFLRKHAVNNELNGASRTYLALDFEAMTQGRIVIVAFFTLAIAVTDYTGISAERRLEIMGHVPGIESNSYFPGYLLAQLARDDRYTRDDFNCLDLVALAEEYISEAIGYVGGRVIYLDCKKPLVSYYERQGYEVLCYDSERGLHKMLKCA